MLVTDVLAVWRLVRLVRRDGITRGLRRGLLDLVADARAPFWTAELIACAWCLSIWIGLFAVAARVLAPRWWPRLARALAISALVGLVSDLVVVPVDE